MLRDSGRIHVVHDDCTEILPNLDDMEPSDKDEKWVYIYALADPVSGEVRYIGKSIRPRERFVNHCNDKSDCHRTHWIRTLLSQGIRPALAILDRLSPDGDWKEAERRWIRYAREEGCRLVNGTDGGDGVEGLSEESRRKITEAWRGRKHSPESLKKIGEASRGRKHTEAYKNYMRKIMTGRQFSEEHRKKLAKARSMPPEKRAEIVARLAAGEGVKAIARAVGVHRMTVSRIKNNRKN